MNVAAGCHELGRIRISLAPTDGPRSAATTPAGAALAMAPRGATPMGSTPTPPIRRYANLAAFYRTERHLIATAASEADMTRRGHGSPPRRTDASSTPGPRSRTPSSTDHRGPLPCLARVSRPPSWLTVVRPATNESLFLPRLARAPRNRRAPGRPRAPKRRRGPWPGAFSKRSFIEDQPAGVNARSRLHD